MPRTADLEQILQERIVAVMRCERGDLLLRAAEALLAGGVRIMEVTFTVPRAHHVLEQLAEKLGDRILLGAGTVLDVPTARTALLSGARFLVCPHLDPEIIQLGNQYDALVIPGAFTPTEVVTAWKCGSAAGEDLSGGFGRAGVHPGFTRSVAAGAVDAHGRSDLGDGGGLSESRSQCSGRRRGFGRSEGGGCR
ncbi:MAG: hypothetical protein KatS3mg110_0959 [Pirellulaceae bacterium]|nr:MAG: hypothetical protein KatS3mg110_0959 [Pirellulaceae bacterium]